KNILYQIDSNFIGGVCFFKGNQKDLVKLNKLYDSHSKLPLFIAIDGEWGLNMRLSEIETFPINMTLGALPKKKYYLVKDMAKVIAEQCRSLGIHINFAPVVDININPDNPVINMRSFGQDKYKVSLLAREYIKGLQENGVMAVVKHFPGHGDTETDSHKATPIIKHDKSFIDSVDSYPFRYNTNKGVWGVMVGHLQIPSLSKDSLKVATINRDIIDGYLRKDVGFEGLVFTDAMNMKGLTNLYGDGQAEVLAVLAGVDILLMPENTDKAIMAIMEAVEHGRIPKKIIEQKCEKILAWKYDMGLVANRGKYSVIDKSLEEKTKILNQKIAENTITLLNAKGENEIEKNGILTTDKDSISLLLLGNANFDTLMANLSDIPLNTYRIHSKMKQVEIDSVISLIDSTKLILTAVGGTRFANSKSRYGIADISIEVLEKIAKRSGENNIVLMFCNPYTFKLIDSAYTCKAFVVAYENNAYTQSAMAKFLKGKIPAKGFLPVKVKRTHIEVNATEYNEVSQEDKFYMDNNINISTIRKIDSIAQRGIEEKAYPGCQVLIAKEGKIIYDKNFGYHTYDTLKEVTSNTMYDIASLTKVMATTIAVMRLYEENKINLEAKISDYIPELKKIEAGNLTIKELLSHYTTLPAVYPFAKKKLKGKNIHQAILKEMKHVPLKSKKYVYSDLNFLLLQYAIENITNESLDEYLQREFYSKMNLQNTTFNPLLNGVNQENIAPTENDTTDRKELIWGQVHDPLAYLNNGV
ncbi:MAG: glycoside hydrolase family 3 N-terminal domain-containing protein, partial [Bacteroidota bacterium]|nr:glycoside hydrolase family 3 N-terminal domain-containing protein [Bacteroidota bacterium]